MTSASDSLAAEAFAGEAFAAEAFAAEAFAAEAFAAEAFAAEAFAGEAFAGEAFAAGLFAAGILDPVDWLAIRRDVIVVAAFGFVALFDFAAGRAGVFLAGAFTDFFVIFFAGMSGSQRRWLEKWRSGRGAVTIRRSVAREEPRAMATTGLIRCVFA